MGGLHHECLTIWSCFGGKRTLAEERRASAPPPEPRYEFDDAPTTPATEPGRVWFLDLAEKPIGLADDPGPEVDAVAMGERIFIRRCGAFVEARVARGRQA